MSRIFLLIALLLAACQTDAYAQAAYTNRDCSIASLSGSSQSLLSGTNFQRKYLYICNTSTVTGDTIGVNFTGGTAALGGTGTITLFPGACKEYAAGSSYLPDVPSNIINVIGTSGQPVACTEGR